ncbi:MAG: hypothetical protein Q4A41_06675 [Bacillota bacterium]|nr:hypothetical protein [Bacillota bacterium]
MHYKVLFRIEKIELVEKLKQKIKNYERYCQEEGDTCEISVVCAGSIVKHFRNVALKLEKGIAIDPEIDIDPDFDREDLDIALCRNALGGWGFSDVFYKNIRTVRAGIGEIIKKKAEGYIEYTIE